MFIIQTKDGQFYKGNEKFTDSLVKAKLYKTQRGAKSAITAFENTYKHYKFNADKRNTRVMGDDFYLWYEDELPRIKEIYEKLQNSSIVEIQVNIS